MLMEKKDGLLLNQSEEKEKQGKVKKNSQVQLTLEFVTIWKLFGSLYSSLFGKTVKSNKKTYSE